MKKALSRIPGWSDGAPVPACLPFPEGATPGMPVPALAGNLPVTKEHATTRLLR